MSTYISTQEAESRIGDDDVWAEVESARELSDGDLKDSGQRQEEPLAAGFQTLISGAQVEWEIEDDPLHTEIIEVARDSVQDRMQPSQTEAIQSDDSDPDDLDRGGRSMWLARNEVSPKISQESDPDDLDRGGSPPEFLRNELYRKKVHEPTHHVANPTMKPPGQSDPEPASRTLHSNTENRPESTESETQSASPSSAPQYHKVQTTEMVRSETTRIIRSFQQENIRIETVLKPDPDIHTLREKEEKLEDHELMLSNLIDELMIDLKKTRGELKGISRKYRKALGDF
ncbi:hypothetical protein BPOR_1313g00020 [Botrytis porri]|uniref:Uncharacterized protein n=2 Tax=Botrytis porri TaxID=87229 RepID=A0A4Z1K6M8_9HELO|nr:hypothetical protein BPOR_1313g00020 [Botrytis porri]